MSFGKVNVTTNNACTWVSSSKFVMSSSSASAYFRGIEVRRSCRRTYLPALNETPNLVQLWLVLFQLSLSCCFSVANSFLRSASSSDHWLLNFVVSLATTSSLIFYASLPHKLLRLSYKHSHLTLSFHKHRSCGQRRSGQMLINVIATSW